MKKFFRRIIRFFTRDYSKPLGDYSSHGSKGEELKLKWGFIVPHTKKAQGAQRGNITEYGYGLDMVANGLSFPHATRDSGGVYGAAKKLKSQGCNASFEGHKNAYNGKAFGFEILVLAGDSLSYNVAVNIAQEFKKAFPKHTLRHGNGVLKVDGRDRGAGNLRSAKRAGMEVALLIEDFFLDNKNDFLAPKTLSNFYNNALA